MELVECDLPLASALQAHWVAAAYFHDSYRAPLAIPCASVVDIFFGIFGHNPRWVTLALLWRNRVVKAFGLLVPADADITHPARRQTYAVGDNIGPWPIFSISENELIAGRDNSHLDFRVSIHREPGSPGPFVVVSTVCVVHNLFGKVYLYVVVPFHRWGVKYLITRAQRAGRL